MKTIERSRMLFMAELGGIAVLEAASALEADGIKVVRADTSKPRDVAVIEPPASALPAHQGRREKARRLRQMRKRAEP